MPTSAIKSVPVKLTSFTSDILSVTVTDTGYFSRVLTSLNTVDEELVGVANNLTFPESISVSNDASDDPVLMVAYSVP